MSDYDDDFEELMQAGEEVDRQLREEQNVASEVRVETTITNAKCGDNPDPNMISCLKKYFGHSAFRPYQWDIVRACVRDRRDQLVVMSTGYGKSVCYQLPALYSNGLTIVVSPLISLMEDQVKNLTTMGVSAAFLGSSQKNSTEIRQGVIKGDYRVLYVTPEYLAAGGRTFLKNLEDTVGITLLAIDEAHCISNWGHDFRDSYRCLGGVRNEFPLVPVMALTATATPQVRRDIVNNLHLKNPLTTCTSFDRPNLFLTVDKKSSHGAETDFRSLLRPGHEGEAPNLGGSTIVYCPTRKAAEEANEILRNMGVSSVLYHAGLSIEARRKAHRSFSSDKSTTIVATVAFGMGIDKPDIRQIIHYGAPKDIESYYQEIGRAGRDGQPSECLVLFENKDFGLWKYFVSELRNEKFKEYKLEMQRKMEDYLATNDCRRRKILCHFENSANSDFSSGGTKCCDNCREKENRKSLVKSGGEESTEKSSEKRDFASDAEKIFGVISDVFRGYSGFGKIYAFLRGMTPHKFDTNLPLFGSGKDRSEKWWRAFAQMLRIGGYFKERSVDKFMTVVDLSPLADNWLDSNGHQLYLRPSKELLDAEIVKKVSSVEYASSQPARILPPQKLRTYKDCTEYNLPMPKAVDENSDVSDQTKSKMKQLYNELISLRAEIADKSDISPYMVVSNKVLLEMAKIRPSTLDNLCRIEELPAERAKRYGAEFIEHCMRFCDENSMDKDQFEAEKKDYSKVELPSELKKLLASLEPSTATTYDMFALQGKEVASIATNRHLTDRMVICHLADAAKLGLPLDLKRLEVDKSKLEMVFRAVHKLGSDVSKLTPIFDALPKDTFDSYARLRLALSILEYEYGLPGSTQSSHLSKNTASPSVVKQPSQTQQKSIVPSKRKLPGWMTAKSNVQDTSKEKKKPKLRL